MGGPGAAGGPQGRPQRVVPPQGSLSLRLPVGRGVVASVSLHPAQPQLLAATQGQVQLWGHEEGTGGDSGDPPGDK